MKCILFLVLTLCFVYVFKLHCKFIVNNDLTGTIPNVFSLSYKVENDLTGTIPNEIRSLTGLTNLDFGKII